MASRAAAAASGEGAVLFVDDVIAAAGVSVMVYVAFLHDVVWLGDWRTTHQHPPMAEHPSWHAALPVHAGIVWPCVPLSQTTWLAVAGRAGCELVVF